MTTSKITVHRGSPPSNSYVWSPFVTKLEARLRFDGLGYKLGAGNPKTAPKGKIPYIDITLPSAEAATGDTESIGDSTLIIQHLVATGILNGLDESLSPAKAAQDLSIRAMLEDRVYFYGAREKWCDNYTVMKDTMLASVPWPLRELVGWLVARKMTATLEGQGTGRFSGDEVAFFKAQVWEAVNALLEASRTDSREPYWVLGGSEPSEADATLYGFIVGGLICDA